MNSVVLTRWRPDKPTSGAALRNWQNIRGLAQLGPVDVVSVGEEDRAERVECVREWATFSIRQRSWWERTKTRCGLMRPGVYRGIDLLHLRSVTRWVSNHGGACGYDVAVIEGLSLASYIRELKGLSRQVVFDAHNVESVFHSAAVSAMSDRPEGIVRRARSWLSRRLMEEAERRAVLGADVVWACSDHDAREIESAYRTPSPVTVVPNAVDVDAYRRADAPAAGDDWSRTPITLVYPGSFAYPPNAEAAMRLITEVLPVVRARGYMVRAILVGRDPTPRMLDAARQYAGVEITGMVESVVPYFAQPCVVTLPITLGSGTRLKILEAFAAGRPVVTTPKGAEGLDVVDNEHLLIREDLDALANAVVDLWGRPRLRESLCANALELVRRDYSWPVAARRIAQSLGIEGNPSSHYAEPAKRRRSLGAREY